jgi:hypothetical protein
MREGRLNESPQKRINKYRRLNILWVTPVRGFTIEEYAGMVRGVIFEIRNSVGPSLRHVQLAQEELEPSHPLDFVADRSTATNAPGPARHSRMGDPTTKAKGNDSRGCALGAHVTEGGDASARLDSGSAKAETHSESSGDQSLLGLSTDTAVPTRERRFPACSKTCLKPTGTF